MLQVERIGSQDEMLKLLLDGRQSAIWTAVPGVVQGFDSGKITATVQPAIKGQVTAPDGSKMWVALPQLLDCPVVFPRGGGVTLTFPIAPGDECLVVFASRCIDAWWANGAGDGSGQIQAEHRMHDLSDGFVIPGPFSQVTKISGINASTAQLRSNDGSTFVELDPQGQVVNITAPGGINFKTDGAITMQAGQSITAQAADSVQLLTPETVIAGNVSSGTDGGGNATFNGPITATGEGTFAGHTVGAHTHANPEGGNVGPPVG